jgi:hypothetical protein
MYVVHCLRGSRSFGNKSSFFLFSLCNSVSSVVFFLNLCNYEKNSGKILIRLNSYKILMNVKFLCGDTITKAKRLLSAPSCNRRFFVIVSS